jgi:hypothetical protein
MAVHIFRREATWYWRRRTPRALANFLGAPACFYEPADGEPGDGKSLKDEQGTIARSDPDELLD